MFRENENIPTQCSVEAWAKDMSAGVLAQEDQRERELNKAFMVMEALNGSIIKRLKYVRDNAIQRCHDPKRPNYRHYGAKGITVCEEWRENRSAFVEYAIRNHLKTFWLKSEMGFYQMDRIDSTKGYTPDNVRFIPGEENCRLSGKAPKPKKLTEEDIAEVVKLREEGLTQREIAERFDVAPSAISYHLRKPQADALRKVTNLSSLSPIQLQEAR